MTSVKVLSEFANNGAPALVRWLPDKCQQIGTNDADWFAPGIVHLLFDRSVTVRRVLEYPAPMDSSFLCFANGFPVLADILTPCCSAWTS